MGALWGGGGERKRERESGGGRGEEKGQKYVGVGSYRLSRSRVV